MDELIPGLPGDISTQILLRLPFDSFSIISSVSKRWQNHISSKTFHHLRKSLGLTRPIIAFSQSTASPGPANKVHNPARTSSSHQPRPAYRLTVFEPQTERWHALPPIPGRSDSGLPLFCQLASVDQKLVVIGGWDPRTWIATEEVHVYDFISATWRRGKPLPGPRRSFFACAAVNGLVLVAGGHDESKNALRSAVAYDVARDEWVPVPDMGRARDECRGVAIGGEVHVVGGYGTEAQGRFTRSADVFDLVTWRWRETERWLDESECPRNCDVGAGGRVFMCRKREVVVGEGGKWQRVAELPEDVRAVLGVVATEEMVVVVGSKENHGGATVVYGLEVGDGEVGVWRKVEAPMEFTGHVQAGVCLEI